MKKLLIMCGTGVATSTVVTKKVKDWLEDTCLLNDVLLYQGNVTEELGRLNDYDIVISTTIVPTEYKARVIMGLPLLTGTGVDDFFSAVRLKIEQQGDV